MELWFLSAFMFSKVRVVKLILDPLLNYLQLFVRYNKRLLGGIVVNCLDGKVLTYLSCVSKYFRIVVSYGIFNLGM